MLPFLIDWKIHGHLFRLPTYGVLLAISFALAYFWSLRRGLKEGEDPRHIENLFLLVILGSVIGGRLFHVVFEEWDYYLSHPEKIIAVWEGGYTFYGSLLGAMSTMYLYCKMRGIEFMNFADLGAPSVLLGLFTGRWGCFFAGCCWGRPTQAPWGVIFSHPDSFNASKEVLLHPTQLYEAFGALLLMGYLEWLYKRKKYSGQILFHGLASYAILRFIVEFYRGDSYRGFVFGGVLSYSQLVSLAILPLALSGMVVYSKPPKKNKK